MCGGGVVRISRRRARPIVCALGLGEEKTPAHLVRHPFGRVPTIDHDGFALYETQAIIRYVDAAFAGPALHARAMARATARMNQLIGIVDWYFFHHVTEGDQLQPVARAFARQDAR